MEITILEPGTGAAELTVNGNKMLAVVTNLNSKIYKQISRQDLLSEPGILIIDGESKEWECTESMEHEGKLIFPGPFYQGKTLADINPDIDILLNMATAYQKVISENLPVTGFYPPGVFIPENGGTLFFPPALINYITNQLSENESLEFWQPYNHPDARGEMQFSFILGVLAYKLLSGNLPYSGSSIIEIREKMRSSKPVEIQFVKPGINSSIAVLINNALSLKDVKPEDWIKQLILWRKEGAVTAVSESERLQIQKTAKKKQSKLEKQFERKQFFSHNWKTIAVITAALIFVISFSIQPIKNAMEPPITTGLSAEEVVETYYTGIMDMEVEIMEDCVNKGVAKSDINEVTQLFVVSKVRMGYEGKSGLVSAQDWNDGIIKKLDPGEQVYGIANLEITKSGSFTFVADYIRWYPDIPDDPESNEIMPPIKVNIKDKLTLEKVKDVWIIVNLERKTTEKQ